MLTRMSYWPDLSQYFWEGPTFTFEKKYPTCHRPARGVTPKHQKYDRSFYCWMYIEEQFGFFNVYKFFFLIEKDPGCVSSQFREEFRTTKKSVKF